MLEPLEVGLHYLEIAKQHATLVEPGQETGMVYYIEGNLLTQMYEKYPQNDLKDKVIKTAEIAISQFENESPAIRLDYQRMLMLKMAFCYLGLGLFCKTIPAVEVSENDLQKATKLLDFVGKPEVWDGMEVRRKMLYHVAMAELSRRRQKKELARCHATEAQKIAKEFDWRTELPNICILLEDIGNLYEERCDDTDENIKAINKLLSEVLQGGGEENV